MSDGIAPEISLVRSLIKNRRLDDDTLRILESVLVCKDVKSLLEEQSSMREFMRSESLGILREITEKTVEQKLSVLEFLVRAFALAGDVESCLALRYEALTLRELKSTSYQNLLVSHGEWLTFAEHSLNEGFFSIAGKACENALLSLQMNEIADSEIEDILEKDRVAFKIKRLRDVAMASSASHSVQAQTAEYLKKKTMERSTKNPSNGEKAQCLASTLFRSGIKKRNAQQLHRSKSQRQSSSKSCSTSKFEVPTRSSLKTCLENKIDGRNKNWNSSNVFYCLPRY